MPDTKETFRTITPRDPVSDCNKPLMAWMVIRTSECYIMTMGGIMFGISAEGYEFIRQVSSNARHDTRTRRFETAIGFITTKSTGGYLKVWVRPKACDVTLFVMMSSSAFGRLPALPDQGEVKILDHASMELLREHHELLKRPE